MIDVDVFPSDTSWLSEPTTGVHQFGGGSASLAETSAIEQARLTFLGGMVRVKMRKALYEQMLSELHRITDIERRRRQRTNS